MAQPKKPPRSVRLPDALWAEVEAFAAKNELKVNSAVRVLLLMGLEEAKLYGAPTHQKAARALDELPLPDEGYRERPTSGATEMLADAMADAKTSRTTAEAFAKGEARGKRQYDEWKAGEVAKSTFRPHPKPGKKK